MSLLYLTLTTFQNSLKEFVRRPAKLVATLLMAALLGFSMFSAAAPKNAPARDAAELGALALLLYAFVFLTNAARGFHSGASFYSLSDIHFVFPAPIAPRRVLLYGLIRQMSSALYVGCLLLFQYAWLHMTYGLSFGGLAVLLLGYVACIFLAQLTAMALYSFTCSDDRLRRVLRGIFFGVSAAAVVWTLLPLLGRPADPIGALTRRANGTALTLFPVAGWLRGAAAGFLGGDFLPAAGWLLLSAAFAAGVVLLLMRARPDFYEDVLQATEAAHSVITAKKEGSALGESPRRVRVGKTGIGRGEGAAAFYHKHLLEDRRSRVLFIDGTSLLFLAVNWAFAFFTRDSGPVPLLAFSVYLQIFSIASGRWVRELLLPYVYLLPEPPFWKLVHICRENLLKSAVEAVVLFVPAALILRMSPALTAACIALRIAFAALLIAGNLLMERIFGSLTNRILLLLLYFFVMLALCVPGAAVAVVACAALGLPLLAGLILFAAWNIVCAALITLLCRDILDRAELNNR